MTDLDSNRAASADILRQGTGLRSGVAVIDTVTGEGVYVVTQQVYGLSGTVDAWLSGVAPSALVSATARDFLDREGAAVGQIVRFWEQRRKDGAIEVLLDVGNPPVSDGAFFAVKVTLIGGAAGGYGSTCAYTYQVFDLDGNMIGTGLTPQTLRIPNVAYTAPSAQSPGLAYYETVGYTGYLRLYHVAEEVPAPVTVTNITDFQVTGVTIQVKTQAQYVLSADDKSAWTTVHTGTACP